MIMVWRWRKGIAAGIGWMGLVGVLSLVQANYSPEERKNKVLQGRPAAPIYRSPFDVAMARDGRTLWVSDRTAGKVVGIQLAEGKATQLGEISVGGKPTGLALNPNGTLLYVADGGGRTVAVVDAAQRKVAARINVGVRPTGLALAPRSQRLFVCNTASDDLSVVDTRKRQELRRIRVAREPMSVALTPDEKTVVVTNGLPITPATEPISSAEVSIIDATSLQVKASPRLPAGGTNVRGVAVSPDGRWAYVAHMVARFNIPPTQLQRGWVNTSALSLIDLEQGVTHTTVLLDDLAEGAADPWGVALSPDGQRLWIALGGVHQVAMVEVGKLQAFLAGRVPEEIAAQGSYDLGSQNVWAELTKDPQARFKLVNDLTALYRAGLRQRYDSGGVGPRHVALSPDGTTVYVTNYYSGNVVGLATDTGKKKCDVPVGPQPEEDLVRKGEALFSDATICFQHWQSCASCHPDARMDGLRWDLLNDGMGNPKRTRSLVNSHRTAPVMSKGVRADMETAIRAGLKHILFCVRPEEDIAAIKAYLETLRPDPSPYLTPDGKLSRAAQRGKKLFEGKAQCAKCHTGPLYTDMKPYDVGTLGELDQPGDLFYTPKLTEVYRTAPYLHDGRAATIQEVLTTYNPRDQHGVTSPLSPQEIADLAEYILSL